MWLELLESSCHLEAYIPYLRGRILAIWSRETIVQVAGKGVENEHWVGASQARISE